MVTASPLAEHLASLPPAQAAAIAATWDAAVRIAPSTVEARSYGMPTLRLPSVKSGAPGPALLSVCGFRRHNSVFPHSGGVIERVGPALAPYAASKGTLQFAVDEAFPEHLLREVITARIAEINERAGVQHYAPDGSLTK